MSRVKRYISNVLWSWTGVVATILIGFLLSPYIIRKVGDANFSVWTLALSLVEYYWLIDLGFRSATIKFSAQFKATGERDKLNEVLSTGVLYTSLAGLVVLMASWTLAPELARVFKIRDEAFPVLVRIVGASWSLGMTFNIFSGCLEGFQRFDRLSRIWLVGLTVRSAGIALLLWRGHGVVAMGYMLLAAQLLGYGLVYLAFRQVVPEARVSWGRATRAMLGEMARYGVHTFTAIVSNLLLGRSVPLLIAYFLPIRYLAYYTIPVRILDYTTDGLGRIGMVTAPNATELMAQGRSKDLVRLGIFTNRYSFTLFAPVAIFLLTYGWELYGLWIRPDFAQECAYLLPVLLMGQVVMAGQTNSVSILFGMGRHRVYARCLLAEALLTAAGAALVLPSYGLYGAVWVTSVLMALNRGAVVCWLLARELRISPLTYAARIYTIPSAIGLTVWLMLAQFKTWVPGRSWSELILAAVVMSVPFALLSFCFVLDARHRRGALDHVRRLIRRPVEA